MKKANMRNVTAWIAAGIVFVLAGFLTFAVYRRLQQISTPADFKSFIDSFGAAGVLVGLGIQILQVFIALIPGEIVEIGLGAAFGALEGTLICLLGVGIASALVFLLVRRFGVKFLELFFSIEKIDGLRFINSENKLNRMVFLLFFIPGTPKDLLTYFVGLTRMSFSRFMIISLIARIPSVVSSTIGGNFISTGEYLSALILFGITGAVSIAGMLVYDGILRYKKYGFLSKPARRVVALFLKICAIPHGSGNTGRLARFCMRFAKRQGLDAEIDDGGNVWIQKPAFQGYEQQPPVIVQAHLDMVCEKKEHCKRDLNRQAVIPDLQGEKLTAKDTTLGADNGIGMAFALAILEDKKLPHPPLQVLLTADEETGMFGANKTKKSRFLGEKLINLDAEEEGILTVGCAGGMRLKCELPVQKSLIYGRLLSVKLYNLTGGHSGVDIVFGRANAVKVLAEMLQPLCERFSLQLVSFSGGVVDNAIPNFAEIKLLLPDEQAETFIYEIKQQESELKNRFSETDPDLSLDVKTENIGQTRAVFQQQTKTVFSFLCTLPNGVQDYCKAFPEKPETSLNLGVISFLDEKVTVTFSLRSFSEKSVLSLAERVEKLTADFGGVTEKGAAYPAWEFKGETALIEKAKKVYAEQNGVPLKTDVIHAGLECGVFCGKKENLECISLGPDIWDVHTPNETVSLPSVDKTYRFLCGILAEKE